MKTIKENMVKTIASAGLLEKLVKSPIPMNSIDSFAKVESWNRKYWIGVLQKYMNMKTVLMKPFSRLK